jgi:DNA modification methylase
VAERFDLRLGDSREVLKGLSGGSVDALVTDPPAGISFMGKTWDHDHGGREGWIEIMASIFEECLRVLKPGAHGLVWALPRTSHWTATALEDAGFEIRDRVSYLHGQGFPKDHSPYRLAIRPEVERQLRAQGVEGEILWR